MYAIVRTGGKQYKVQKGDVIRVEKMDGKEESKPLRGFRKGYRYTPAEIIEKYAGKGKEIGISGKLKSRSYEDMGGRHRPDHLRRLRSD